MAFMHWSNYPDELSNLEGDQPFYPSYNQYPMTPEESTKSWGDMSPEELSAAMEDFAARMPDMPEEKDMTDEERIAEWKRLLRNQKLEQEAFRREELEIRALKQKDLRRRLRNK
jgi:hypothetical protein